MQNCVLRCFNQSMWNQSETWASNCTEMIDYCPYLDNQTCSEVVTSCMYRAFQPKPDQWWSAWSCTNQCDDATYQLCNYTNIINYTDCQNGANNCYEQCFSYDYDNWNWTYPNNSNNSNNTNGSWWGLASSKKLGFKIPSITCNACKKVVSKVEKIINKYGCNHQLRDSITVQTTMYDICEEALGLFGENLAHLCVEKFTESCSSF